MILIFRVQAKDHNKAFRIWERHVFKKTEPCDENLVRQALAGDCRAFSALVSKYRTRIMRLTLRYARNEADAEDLVQDTFIKAYRALPNFRGDSAFYSWLHRIAINAANTSLVLRAREARFFVSTDSTYEGANMDNPENLVVTDELVATLNAAIDNLCEEQRQAIVLCEIDGLSYRQVASAMSCPVGTVRSRVFRAREAIHLRMRTIFDEGLGRARSKRHQRAWTATPLACAG